MTQAYFTFQRPSMCAPHTHTHTKRYAAASPHLTFYIFKILKFSYFKKEPTRSLKMIWIMIETCWSVLSVLILTF